MKLTNIYPSHIKPVRVGVYKTSVDPKGRLEYWSYWNGIRWGYAYSCQQQALPFKGDEELYAYQNKRWQGLTTKDGK